MEKKWNIYSIKGLEGGGGGGFFSRFRPNPTVTRANGLIQWSYLKKIKNSVESVLTGQDRTRTDSIG